MADAPKTTAKERMAVLRELRRIVRKDLASGVAAMGEAKYLRRWHGVLSEMIEELGTE
jgi:hypothetical protein